MEMASQLIEKVSEVKETAESLARTAGKKLHEARTDTAGALHTAARSVRTTGRQSARAIDGFATEAADKLEAAASYVKSYDLKKVRSSLRQTIRRYPVPCMMLVAAIGFMAGSTAVRKFTR